MALYYLAHVPSWHDDDRGMHGIGIEAVSHLPGLQCFQPCEYAVPTLQHVRTLLEGGQSSGDGPHASCARDNYAFDRSHLARSWLPRKSALPVTDEYMDAAVAMGSKERAHTLFHTSI